MQQRDWALNIKGKNVVILEASAFFHLTGIKIITTSGGGMLVSNNEDYTEKLVFYQPNQESLKFIMNIRN